LIKNNENIFVAIVFDMKRDLHWFVHPDFRGKGHLTEAMKIQYFLICFLPEMNKE
jgi:hypothetical protein